MNVGSLSSWFLKTLVVGAVLSRNGRLFHRNMTETGWGWLAPFEGVGSLTDQQGDFRTLSLEESIQNHSSGDHKHASHGMIFARDPQVLWDLYPNRAVVLMQMRFDGVLGFPGGLVDPGEDPLTAVNREMKEEMGLDMGKHAFTQDNYLATFYNEKKKLVLHFYTKEVSLQEFQTLETNALNAPEYGIETLGIIRPPLFTMGDGMRGLPAFLANRFAGNARDELLLGLRKHQLLSDEEITTALAASEQLRHQ